MVSGYPTSTNLPRVDELSTDPQDLRRQKNNVSKREKINHAREQNVDEI